MRDGNSWMENFALSFFRRNGARKHFIRANFPQAVGQGQGQGKGQGLGKRQGLGEKKVQGQEQGQGHGQGLGQGQGLTPGQGQGQGQGLENGSEPGKGVEKVLGDGDVDSAWTAYAASLPRDLMLPGKTPPRTPVNTHYQHALSTKPINTCYKHTSPCTCLTPYQHILSITSYRHPH